MFGSNASLFRRPMSTPLCPAERAVAALWCCLPDRCAVMASQNPVVALELEHYPGMTERVLEQLVRQARERWQLGGVRLVHRVGRVALGEEIVLVAVGAAHRRQAFAAAEYLMDKLKSEAPFWKKEHRRDGSETWVAAKLSDEKAASRWGD